MLDISQQSFSFITLQSTIMCLQELSSKEKIEKCLCVINRSELIKIEVYFSSEQSCLSSRSKSNKDKAFFHMYNTPKFEKERLELQHILLLFALVEHKCTSGQQLRKACKHDTQRNKEYYYKATAAAEKKIQSRLNVD